MSVPPEGPRGHPALRGAADQQPRDGDDEDTAGAPALKRPKREIGRFSLLLIDNVTGKSTRVDVWPLRLDTILRPSKLDRSLDVGWLVMQLQEAATKLWPEFGPVERKPLTGAPLKVEITDVGPNVQFMPRWRRRNNNTNDEL